MLGIASFRRDVKFPTGPFIVDAHHAIADFLRILVKRYGKIKPPYLPGGSGIGECGQ